MGKSVGVKFNQHEILWDYCTELFKNNARVRYIALSVDNQKKVRENAEEHYLAYIFVQNSSGQHNALCCELQNDFTKGSDHYLEIRSQALLFLDKYSKYYPAPAASEGTSFAEKQRIAKKKGGMIRMVLRKNSVTNLKIPTKK